MKIYVIQTDHWTEIIAITGTTPGLSVGALNVQDIT